MVDLADGMKFADDPAKIGGYPLTLPLEIAMRMRSVKETCDMYAIDAAEWARIRVDPVFIRDLERCVEAIRRDGVGFKTKAALQAESLLETSWALIHSPNGEVTPAVKADLIKFTVRAAGLDGSKDQSQGATANVGLSINLHLG